MKIYCITNSINDKQYVGQTTKSIAARWKQHCLLSGRCRALESAIRKYGVGAFSIMEIASAESQYELDRLEQFWIAELNTVSPAGYNLSGGGNGAGKMHESTRAIISANARRQEHLDRFEEIRNRPEVREKLSSELKARWADDRYKEKTGASIKAALNKPEVKARRRTALRIAWAKPENKIKLLAAQAKALANPESNEKRADSMRCAWNEPGAREQRASAIRAAKSTPEFKARYAATNARPEVKARRSASSSAKRLTDEQKAARSSAMTGKKRGPYKDCKPRPAMAAKWADPVWREKVLAARRDAARKTQLERNER